MIARRLACILAGHQWVALLCRDTTHTPQLHRCDRCGATRRA